MGDRSNVVRTVTVLTRGLFGRRSESGMDDIMVVFVAACAYGWREVGLVGHGSAFQIRMTVNTRELAVNRSGEGGRVDVQLHPFPVQHFLKTDRTVAHEASGIVGC